MIDVFISSKDAFFRRKSPRAREAVVRRFLAANLLVNRCGTHTAQQNPAVMIGVASDFIASMKAKIEHLYKNHKLILNMDQTPIFFSMEPKTTIHFAGSRTVNIRSSSSSTMRVTVAAAVTAEGGLITPMIVFKGQPNGRIARTFGTFPNGSEYCCQENAWMDEQVMLKWVDQVNAESIPCEFNILKLFRFFVRTF